MSIMSIEDIIRSATKGVKKSPEPVDGLIIEKDRSAKEVDWEAVRIWKKPEDIEKSLDKWKTFDFVSYCRYVYFNKYNQDWKLVRKSACVEMLRLKDKLIDGVGHCDNDVLKAYIDYYFKYVADRTLRKKKIFLISHMMEFEAINRFYRSYKGEKKSEKVEANDLIDPRKMENLFLLSHDRFLIQYGINLAVHYLVHYQSYSSKDALSFVYQKCRKLRADGKLSSVIKSTEDYSPYPNWLSFHDADRLLKKIDKSLSVKTKKSVGSKKYSLLKR